MAHRAGTQWHQTDLPLSLLSTQVLPCEKAVPSAQGFLLPAQGFQEHRLSVPTHETLRPQVQWQVNYAFCLPSLPGVHSCGTPAHFHVHVTQRQPASS